MSDEAVVLPPGEKPQVGKADLDAAFAQMSQAPKTYETLEYTFDLSEPEIIGSFAFEYGAIRGATRKMVSFHLYLPMGYIGNDGRTDSSSPTVCSIPTTLHSGRPVNDNMFAISAPGQEPSIRGFVPSPGPPLKTLLIGVLELR